MAKRGRPPVEIDWVNIDQKRFAIEVLEDAFGGAIPAFIDPIKKVKKIANQLSKEEIKLFKGSIFYSYPAVSYKDLSIEKRLKIAVSAWIAPYKNKKKTCPFEFCGFTVKELISHIEKQFEPWMNWNNWGQWHVDHIIPRSLYGNPYTKEEVFGLQNLRPLSRSENIRKGNKIV